MMVEKIKGEAAYLIPTMTADTVLRMRPQNLLTVLLAWYLETVT
jgi:hypothetical protein